MTSNIKNNWHKSSWRSHPIKQQPKYKDLTKLAKTEESLSSYPALIYFDEAIKLDDKNPIIYSNRGLVNRKLERFELAIKDY